MIVRGEGGLRRRDSRTAMPCRRVLAQALADAGAEAGSHPRGPVGVVGAAGEDAAVSLQVARGIMLAGLYGGGDADRANPAGPAIAKSGEVE